MKLKKVVKFFGDTDDTNIVISHYCNIILEVKLCCVYYGSSGLRRILQKF